MKPKKVYAVYVQYSPDWKYEKELRSIWSIKEAADSQVITEKQTYDYSWVEELSIDVDDLYFSQSDEEPSLKDIEIIE